MRRRYTSCRTFRIHSLHEGSGPPVLLLHGLISSTEWWRYNIPAIAGSFSTHAIDLVGFGKTRGMPPSISEMAEIVVEWMDLVGLTSTHVIGHSMGGQIAIHMAARHADRIERLVLVSAAGIPRERSLLHAARFLAEIIPPRAWGNPRFLPRIARDSVAAGPHSLLRATINILRDDVRPLLPLIPNRTLLVWGTLDALTPLRDGKTMAGLIANGHLSIYQDAAHMPMIDQPERFNQEIVAFLEA